MLFKILKLFGLDLAARIEAAKVGLEMHVERVTNRVGNTARETALVAVFGVAALITLMMAATVGLIALYRFTADAYGIYAGLGADAAVLLFVTAVLAALIVVRVRRFEAPKMSNVLARDDAATQPRPAANSALPVPSRHDHLFSPPADSPASAGDLVAPLAFVMSDLIKLPTLGNKAIDEMIGKVRATAGGSADDAVYRAANVIRFGSRLDLFLVLGATAALSWLVTANAQPRP